MAEPYPAGLLESLGQLAGTVLEIVQTRIELFSNEVEEEAWQVWQKLVLILAAVVCFGLAALMFSALLVLLFWESHPIAALVGLGCLYLVAGVLLVRAVGARMRKRSPVFSNSLAELAKDREYLEQRRERTPG